MEVRVYQIQSSCKISKYPNTVAPTEMKHILKNYYFGIDFFISVGRVLSALGF